LAKRLAEKRKVSMTDAVIDALEAELRREAESIPLAERLASLASELRAKARAGGRDMSKDEIDAMWGHS
jgi:antitoxin VapB